MKCPNCGFLESKVIDSRPTEEGKTIRRRRECLSCTHRFTTYEKVEETPLMVIKKDGNREIFDKNKVLNGIIRACQKRSFSLQDMEEMANSIERELSSSFEKEVRSSVIGEAVMRLLKTKDDVAYVRFASVYRRFNDINSFMEELKTILDEREEGEE